MIIVIIKKKKKKTSDNDNDSNSDIELLMNNNKNKNTRLSKELRKINEYGSIMGNFPGGWSVRARQFIYVYYLQQRGETNIGTVKLGSFLQLMDDDELEQILKHGKFWCGDLFNSSRFLGWTVNDKYESAMTALLDLMPADHMSIMNKKYKEFQKINFSENKKRDKKRKRTLKQMQEKDESVLLGFQIQDLLSTMNDCDNNNSSCKLIASTILSASRDDNTGHCSVSKQISDLIIGNNDDNDDDDIKEQ
eukprot:448846_1